MKKYIINIILFFSLAINCWADDNSIRVIVNDSVITDLDINKRMELILKIGTMSHDFKSEELLREHVKSMLIDEILIKDSAKELGVEVDEMDLKMAMQSIADGNSITLNQFNQNFKERGVDLKEFESQITSQLYLNKYIGILLRPRIAVSNQEIEESRKSIMADLGVSNSKVSKVKLAEIVLYPNNNDADSLIRFGHAISNDLKEGADFTKMAKQFSNASTASSGGEIGWFYMNQIAPQIAVALESIKKGGISEPIIMNDGVHILKVLDITHEKKSNVDIAHQDKQIEEMILNKKLNLQIKGTIQKLRRNAYIQFK